MFNQKSSKSKMIKIDSNSELYKRISANTNAMIDMIVAHYVDAGICEIEVIASEMRMNVTLLKTMINKDLYNVNDNVLSFNA